MRRFSIWCFLASFAFSFLELFSSSSPRFYTPFFWFSAAGPNLSWCGQKETRSGIGHGQWIGRKEDSSYENLTATDWVRTKEYPGIMCFSFCFYFFLFHIIFQSCEIVIFISLFSNHAQVSVILICLSCFLHVQLISSNYHAHTCSFLCMLPACTCHSASKMTRSKIRNRKDNIYRMRN